VSDRKLREAVEQALGWELIINAEDIGVLVKDGVVTLSGHVNSYPQRREAEKAAGTVPGVKAVVCDLNVTPLPHAERSDEEIAHAAARAIARNLLLPKDKIQVWVDRGRITLEGSVDWQYQRKSADQCVRCLSGVYDVNNHIVVAPNAERLAVKNNTEATLLGNAKLDADGVRVEVRGDHVILRGTVQSWEEHDQLERAAWGSRGVRTVENLLMVNPVLDLVAQ